MNLEYKRDHDPFWKEGLIFLSMWVGCFIRLLGITLMIVIGTIFSPVMIAFDLWDSAKRNTTVRELGEVCLREITDEQ